MVIPKVALYCKNSFEHSLEFLLGKAEVAEEGELDGLSLYGNPGESVIPSNEGAMTEIAERNVQPAWLGAESETVGIG